MDKIEKIRQEIERLKNNSELAKKEWINEGYNQNAFAEDCRIKSFDKLLSFIDSLPEEKPSEDLNKLIQKWDRIDINTVLKVKVKATGKVIDGFYDGRGHFDHFIDHDVFDRYSIDDVELIQEEKPSEDLEEAAERFSNAQNKNFLNPEIVKNVFINGTKWGVEQFAKVVRANLSEIGKDAQYQFEKLYFEITGNKMYGGYKD